uniref:Uncharacterized protein n=1 Tax=Glossina brevipalpis TaxID=37001 RepID=A0A1A9X3V2_9MUSC
MKIITNLNLKDIYEHIDHKELQYENVEIDTKWDEFSAMKHEILLNIFIKLGPSVVDLKFHSFSTLSMPNDVLPNLKTLDLSYNERVDERAPVDLNKFSRLKSLLMPVRSTVNTDNLLSQLMANSTQMTGMQLEKLSFGDGYPLASILDTLDIDEVIDEEYRTAILESLPKESSLKVLYNDDIDYDDDNDYDDYDDDFMDECNWYLENLALMDILYG